MLTTKLYGVFIFFICLLFVVQSVSARNLVPVYNCQNLGANDTDYTLMNESVLNDTDAVCFSITGNNVRFFCNGQHIHLYGANDIGITITGDNAEVYYCKIYLNDANSDSGKGILIDGGAASPYIKYNEIYADNSGVVGIELLSGVTDADVIGSRIENISIGIHFTNADLNNLTSNILYNCSTGIKLDSDSDGNNITEVNIQKSFSDGIYFSSDSGGNKVVWPTIYNSTDGIHIAGSWNIVDDGDIEYNNYGIYLSSGANYNKIIDSAYINNNNIGAVIESTHNNLTGNVFNYNIVNGIKIDGGDYNILDINNFGGNGESGVNITNAGNYNNLTRNSIGVNDANGIYIKSSDNNFLSENTISYNSRNGAELYDSDLNIFNGSTFMGNILSGIVLNGSSINQLIANEIGNANYQGGIQILNSVSNSVSGNRVFQNNKIGIFLENSDENYIRNNSIGYNEEEGIAIYRSSDSNEIDNNSIVHNGDGGIYINGSSFNAISNNTVYDNIGFGGIHLNSADLNYLKNNTIKENLNLGIIVSQSDQVQMSGNVISESFLDGQLQLYGIIVDGEENDHVGIIYNSIYNHPRAGIWIDSSPKDFLVQENMLEGNAIGILLNSVGPSQTGAIHTIYKNEIYNGHHGIVISDYSQDINVNKNKIYGTINEGIAINSSSNEINIYGNEIGTSEISYQRPDYGIFMSDISTINIEDNIIQNIKKNGIYMENTTVVNLVKNRIHDINESAIIINHCEQINFDGIGLDIYKFFNYGDYAIEVLDSKDVYGYRVFIEQGNSGGIWINSGCSDVLFGKTEIIGLGTFDSFSPSFKIGGGNRIRILKSKISDVTIAFSLENSPENLIIEDSKFINSIILFDGSKLGSSSGFKIKTIYDHVFIGPACEFFSSEQIKDFEARMGFRVSPRGSTIQDYHADIECILVGPHDIRIPLIKDPDSSNITYRNLFVSNYSIALVISDAVNVSILDNIFTDNGIGLFLNDSSNDSIQGNIIVNNSYGVYLNASYNNSFRDNNLSNNDIFDVYLNDNSTNNVFTNCEYNISKEYVESGSSLYRKWWYRAYVEDGYRNPMANLNVSVYDTFGNLQFKITTDSSGWTDLTGITDYINNGGTRTYYPNYIINVTNGTYTDTHVYNITTIRNIYEDIFTLGNKTIINSCGLLNQSGMTYILNKSVVSNKTCFNITVNYVMLNCNNSRINYSLDGNVSYGVYSNKNFSTVRNCVISEGANSSGGTSGFRSYGGEYSEAEMESMSMSSLGIESDMGTLGTTYATVGIYFLGNKDGRIWNNSVNVFRSSSISVKLESSSNNDIKLNKGNSSYRGLHTYLTSYNNVFINNKWEAGSDNAMYFQGCSNTSLTNESAKSNSSTAIKIICHDNRLNSVVAESSGSAFSGIWVTSRNNTFNSITAKGGNAIHIDGVNNYFYNCKNISGVTYDIEFMTSGALNSTFVNCSYNTSKEAGSSGSSLYRKWWYRAYVEDYFLNPMNISTNVTAYNRSGNIQFVLPTNFDGWTNTTEIIDYIVISGARRYYSNYTINATNGTYTETHYYNITLSQNIMNDTFTFNYTWNCSYCNSS